MNKNITSLILLLGLFLIGCTEVTTSSNTNKYQQEYIGNYGQDYYATEVYRFIDTDYNNICYITKGFREAGLSCVQLR